MDERSRAPAEWRALVKDTMQGLLRRRRGIPIACLSLPLIAMEFLWSPDLRSGFVTLAMCLLLPLLAPMSWRLLFSRPAAGPFIWSFALYLLCGVISVGSIGLGIPELLAMDQSFMTDPATLLAVLLIFWVGGWTLGRDIDLEGDLQDAIHDADDMALLAEHAQLLALRAHLDPHFLYNTLNAIAEWCQVDPQQAEAGTLKLSRMLRVILEGVEVTTWPLDRELQLCHDLLDMYRLRDPKKLQYTEDIQLSLEAEIPPMLLLSLLENAIKHGPWAGHRGTLSLSLSTLEGNRGQLRLRNPGSYQPSEGGGRGLRILQRRLRLLYGDDATLELRALGADQTEASVCWPLQTRGEAP